MASKWDPRLAVEVVDEVLGDDPGRSDDERELLATATAPLRELLAAGLGLPARQTIHGDITDYNVLVTADARSTADQRLIDFGDSTRTWRIADLANACVAVVCRELDEPLHALLAVVAGYHELAPLDAVALDALWPLILGRAAACAALSTRQLSLTPDSDYTLAQYAGDWRALRTLIGFPTGLPEARPLRARAGAGRPAGAAVEQRAELLPVLAPAGRRAGAAPRRQRAGRAGATARLPVARPPTALGRPRGRRRRRDRSVDRDRRTARRRLGRPARGRGRGPRPARDDRPLGRGPSDRRGEPGDVAPDTLHLGADLFAPAGTGVRAPLAATVIVVAERELTLELAPGRCLRLAGIEAIARAGGAVTAGAVVGYVAERTDGGPTARARAADDRPGPAGARRSAAARRVAGALSRPVAAGRRRRRRAAATGRGRRCRAPRVGGRRGAGALLRAADRDRPRQSPVPVRRVRPPVPRHGQQHRRRRPLAPTGGGGSGAPVPAAEHQFAVSVSVDDRVRRAAGGVTAARA